MGVHNRIKLLKEIYKIHAQVVGGVQAACQKGCATCCTCNVTATSLESLLAYDYLAARGRGGQAEQMSAIAPALRYRPLISINRMAGMCMRGETIPEETNDPGAGICPLLEDDSCSIYPVRPFGCRAMLSSSDCRVGGEAQMPPLVLTVNNVLMQYLEAVDQPGFTGNFLDNLHFLSIRENRDAYEQGVPVHHRQGMPLNISFPVLMVPPEHRRAIAPLMQSLNRLLHMSQ